jgi:hypothetical protein
MGGQNFRSPGIPQLPYFPGRQQPQPYVNNSFEQMRCNSGSFIYSF